MQIPAQCDVVVIGGGPAGSTASALLARKGYDVVLVDSLRHPRPVVGESLLPHLWKFLDGVGATAVVEKEDFIVKSGGTTVWNGMIRQVNFSDFGFNRPGLHVERDRLDFLLLENAKEKGAQVYEGVTAKSVMFADGRAAGIRYSGGDGAVSGEISAKFVVDASGQKAVISRQMGFRVIDEDFRFVSLWGYHKDSQYVALDGSAHPFSEVRKVKPTTFVCSLGNWGWCWHIPLRESTSVGLIIPLEDFKKAKVADSDLEQYYLDTCYSDPWLSRLLEGSEYIPGRFGVIRDYSYVPTTLSGPGFCIIGDAAAFVDPIFSVGCILAMYGGNVAAWTIDRSLMRPAGEENYRAVFNRQYTGFYEVARAMALPGSATSAHSLDLARRHVSFQTSNEQKLMYSAALMTVRENNFHALAGFTDSEHAIWNKTKELADIRF